MFPKYPALQVVLHMGQSAEARRSKLPEGTEQLPLVHRPFEVMLNREEHAHWHTDVLAPTEEPVPQGRYSALVGALLQGWQLSPWRRVAVSMPQLRLKKPVLHLWQAFPGQAGVFTSVLAFV